MTTCSDQGYNHGMSLIRKIRVKILEDELFSLLRESHEAWSWAPKGLPHRRYAEKVDERINMLQERLGKLTKTS